MTNSNQDDPSSPILNILLVEVDNDTIDVTQYALNNHYPANCTVARSGKDALALLSDNTIPTFNLIILARDLPDTTGADLSVAIREIQHYNSTPIIMQNSYSKHEIKEELEHAKVDIYLEKPYDIEKLFPLIKELVRSSKQ